MVRRGCLTRILAGVAAVLARGTSVWVTQSRSISSRRPRSRARRAPSSLSVRAALDREAALEREGHRRGGARGSGSTMPWPRNAPFSKTAMGPRSSRPSVSLVKRTTRNGCDQRIRHAAVGREEEDRLARHGFGEQQHHRRALVRDVDRGRQVVARGARLDRHRRERGLAGPSGSDAALPRPAARGARWASARRLGAGRGLALVGARRHRAPRVRPARGASSCLAPFASLPFFRSPS